MVKVTLLARVSDGLPLAESLDNEREHDLDVYKQQAKAIFKQQSQKPFSQQDSRLSVDAGPFMFHYLTEEGVCYLVLADKGYPKKLAYQYLEELQREFSRLYGPQINTAARPYAFIKFDTFIQKTKKLYLDSSTQRNLARLNNDLTEVHSIMTKNIQDVLGQGEKLDRMQVMSADLAAGSKMYADRAKDLYRQALLRKYMPFAVVGGTIVFVLWFRWVFYSD